MAAVRREITQNQSDRDASVLDARFAAQDLRITLDMISPIHSLIFAVQTAQKMQQQSPVRGSCLCCREHERRSAPPVSGTPIHYLLWYTEKPVLRFKSVQFTVKKIAKNNLRSGLFPANQCLESFSLILFAAAATSTSVSEIAESRFVTSLCVPTK